MVKRRYEVVWSTQDQFGDPRRRAVPFCTRYMRQQPGQEEPVQAFEMRGTYKRRGVTVLDDGPLLLGYGPGLVWAFPNGTTREELLRLDGKRVEVLAGYPDGLPLEAGAVYFVPIDERFATREAAERWVSEFVEWYNHEHRHSAIRYVAPADRHSGRDVEVLARRQEMRKHVPAARNGGLVTLETGNRSRR